MLFRTRLNRSLEWKWVADSARLELYFWLNDLTGLLVDGLCYIEHCKSLRDGDEQGVVRNPTTWADATTVTEDEVAWVRFGFVVRSVEVSLWAESHRLRVDLRIMCEPPCGSVLERSATVEVVVDLPVVGK